MDYDSASYCSYVHRIERVSATYNAYICSYSKVLIAMSSSISFMRCMNSRRKVHPPPFISHVLCIRRRMYAHWRSHLEQYTVRCGSLKVTNWLPLCCGRLYGKCEKTCALLPHYKPQGAKIANTILRNKLHFIQLEGKQARCTAA